MKLTDTLSSARNADLNGHSNIFGWLAKPSYPSNLGVRAVDKIGIRMQSALANSETTTDYWTPLLAKIILTETVKDRPKLKAFALLLSLPAERLTLEEARVIEEISNAVLEGGFVRHPESQNAMVALSYYALMRNAVVDNGKSLSENAYSNYASSLANILVQRGCVDPSEVQRLTVDDFANATTSYVSDVIGQY